MRIPRDLGGNELAAALCRTWGYVIVHQTGSHIILDTEQPSHQRMAIPNHRALRIGTLNNILRAVSQHKSVSREKILATL
ncbi:MAG: type II toxin-antitoxin system HicA family toxin [Deltaproteobacteria bacterium]|nr:type II toxin-antitoxin system HicA family toxin [Deltaproteobacteria bacterium]